SYAIPADSIPSKSTTTADLPSDEPISISTERIKLGEPLPDATYDSLEDLVRAYSDHCRDKGYGITWERNDKLVKGTKTIYMCDRGGKYRDQRNPDLHGGKRRNKKKAQAVARQDLYSKYKLLDSRTANERASSRIAIRTTSTHTIIELLQALKTTQTFVRKKSTTTRKLTSTWKVF
ncbi:hypothetical protein OnM2_010004, partial [Erysiphe neolycopersici]